jgi:hypothetical protein
MSQIDQDTQNWLDILGGQERPDADAKTVREAEALRDALLARQDPVPLKSATLDKILTRLAEEDNAEGKTPTAKNWNYGLSIAASVMAGVLISHLASPLIDTSREESKPDQLAQKEDTSSNNELKSKSIEKQEALFSEQKKINARRAFAELRQLGCNEAQLIIMNIENISGNKEIHVLIQVNSAGTGIDKTQLEAVADKYDAILSENGKDVFRIEF